MRIISGERRGHKFDGPTDRRTRPTSDMVRESMFNILQGALADRPVIDLFAGTGALGLEALSRGARRATFVERRRENVALIHRNLAALRFEGLGTVVLADAYRWARQFEPEGDAPFIVFVDPPYQEYESHPDRLRELLAGLSGRLPDGSILVAEAGGRLAESTLPDLDAWDLRRYSGTRLAIREIGDERARAAEVEPDEDGPMSEE